MIAHLGIQLISPAKPLGMSTRTLMDLALAVTCWAAVTTVIALRLTGVVDWSWWSITAPLWLPLVRVAAGVAVNATLRRLRR